MMWGQTRDMASVGVQNREVGERLIVDDVKQRFFVNPRNAKLSNR